MHFRFLSIPFSPLWLIAAGTVAGCSLEISDPERSSSDPTTKGEPSDTRATDEPWGDTASDAWAHVEQAIYRDAEGRSTSYEVAVQSETLGQGDLTVLMIVDRSGSMGTPWDGSTKWHIVRSALDAAIVGVEDQVTIGALFFPMENLCEVAPLSDPRQFQFQSGRHFQERLRDDVPVVLGGATPMYAAFVRADEAIARAAVDGALEERFRVVIMTDGLPNCSGLEDELVGFADSWRELGVDVRVLGLPGSEAAALLLDRLAGKEVDPSVPYTPEPPTVVDTSQSSEDTGYVAPSNADDVEDSLHPIVR